MRKSSGKVQTVGIISERHPSLREPRRLRLLRGSWGRWRGRRWSVAASGVYQIFQLFAGLEERNFLGGDFYALAGFGITADARLALTGTEAAKTANLDFV